jgi:hypothetical protein
VADALDGIYSTSGCQLNICRDEVWATLGRSGYGFVFASREYKRGEAEFPQPIFDQHRRENLIFDYQRVHDRVPRGAFGGSTMVSQPPRPTHLGDSL